MTKTAQGSVHVLRFTLKSIGPERTERELREAVEEAKKEAVEEFGAKRANVKAEPEGGFLAAGLEWVWLLHVSLPYLHAAGTGLATAAGGAAGKKLFDYFAKALRKRNVLPGEPRIVQTKEKTATRKSQPKNTGKRSLKKNLTKH